MFRRKDRLTLALYPSVGKLAARGRFYSDDALRDYDVLDYSIEAVDRSRAADASGSGASADPRSLDVAVERQAAAGGDARGIRRHERRVRPLLHLRIRGQNTVVVNLPRVVLQDSDLTLVVTYAGACSNQELDTDTIAVAADAQEQGPADLRGTRVSAQQSIVLVSAESGAGLRDGLVADHRASGLYVHRERSSRSSERRGVASRHPAGSGGSRVSHSEPISRLRYLALVVSRLWSDRRGTRRHRESDDPGSGVDSIAVSVRSHSSLRCQSRQVAQRYREHPAVLLVAHGRCAVHIGDHRAARERPARRPQPGLLRGHQYSLSFANVELARRPGLVRKLPRSSSWRTSLRTSGGARHRLEELSRAVDQRGLRAVLRGALRAEDRAAIACSLDMLRQFRRWSLSESDQGPCTSARGSDSSSETRGSFERSSTTRAPRAAHAAPPARRRGVLSRTAAASTWTGATRRPAPKISSGRWRRSRAACSIASSSAGSTAAAFRACATGTQIGDKQVVVRFEQAGDQVFDIPVTVTLTYADGRTVNVVVPVTDVEVERTIPTEVRPRVQVNRDSAALAEFVEEVGGPDDPRDMIDRLWKRSR